MTGEKNSTIELIAELVTIAKDDVALWKKFKDREIEFEQRYSAARAQEKWLDSSDVDLPPPTRPVFFELIADFMHNKPDKYKKIMHSSFGLAIRKEVRIELGLPL